MLWIVGKIFEDFAEYLNENAIPFGLFIDKDNPEVRTYGAPTATIDCTSPEALVASLEQQIRPTVSAIMVAGYEQYVVPASWLCAWFQVPGLTPDAAVAATDKLVMRHRFQAWNPLITPAFHKVSTWQDIEEFMTTHTYPVMLKPTNLMKSLLVTQNYSLDDLHTNYTVMRETLPHIQTTERVVLTSEILIEEYLAGSMHTVVGFADVHGHITLLQQITDCITAQERNIPDNHLYSRQLPSRLREKDIEAILATARQGAEALGVTSSPLHIEIMLTAAGAKIIEIGARLGGYRSRLYAYACGIDLHKAAIDTAFGRLPTLRTQGTLRCCAMIELFATTSGAFSGIEHEQAIRSLPSFVRLAVKRHKGEMTGPAKEGFRAAAVVLLGHIDTAVLDRDLAFLDSQVRVIVQH